MDADRKRDLKKAARRAEREAFLKAMPFDAGKARMLFDNLDDALQADSCHHDLRHTVVACDALRIPAAAAVTWLREQGAGCDCEVLANVEQRFEDARGSAR